MMMMMMVVMMMDSFCEMVDRRKAFSLISSREHCQRSSPSRNSNTPRAGFEPVQNLSSGFVEWRCAVLITPIPRRPTIAHRFSYVYYIKFNQKYSWVHCCWWGYYQWQLQFFFILVGKVSWDITLCDKRFSRNLLPPGNFVCLRSNFCFHA